MSRKSIDRDFIVTHKLATTKPSEVCKDTDGGSDPGFSYPFKLSCFACDMTVRVYAKIALYGTDSQPYILLSMW